MRNVWLTKCDRLSLWLVFFLCGLSAAPAGNAQPAVPPVSAPAVTPLAGKIAHITVLGNKNISDDAVYAILAQKVGDLYSSQAAEKDLAAIHGMGVFQQTVSMSATSVPSGVDLTYTVAEYPVVRGIRFTADTPTKEPTVPAAVLIARMKTHIGQVLNTNVLTSDLAALFDRSTGYIAKQGRLADVSTALNIDPKTGVITIPLVEYRIQSIQVTGSSRVRTADILAQMHARVGDLYDGNALTEDRSLIYETNKFKEVKDFTWSVTVPGKVSITIPVVEREAAVDGLDEKRGKVVPFLYDPVTNPIPTVQVSINGRPALPFLLDTGTTAALSLDHWAAEELDLKPTGPAGKIGDLAFRRTPIRGIALQGREHGSGVAFDIHEAVIIDLSILKGLPGPRLAGIVGLGMLGPVTTRFDFTARTLTVFAYAHPPLRVPTGTTLPLRLNSIGVFTARATLAPDNFADLILDTGSTSTQVPLSALGVLHPTAIAFNSGNQRIEGMYISPELRLPSLTFGPLRVPDVVAGTLPVSASPSLGMDILAGYRLTLDGPNGQATLEPAARGGRYVKGWSGLGIKHANEGWSVKALRAGSPARRAGLRAGDEIVSIGGDSIRGLSWQQVTTLLAGVSGKPVRVLMRRGGRKETAFSWVPLDDFSAPATAIDGLTTTKVSGGPWVIADVTKDCPGDQSGLRRGDQITRIEGEVVSGMSLDRYVELASKPSVLLVVERAGRVQPLSVKLSLSSQPSPPLLTLP